MLGGGEGVMQSNSVLVSACLHVLYAPCMFLPGWALRIHLYISCNVCTSQSEVKVSEFSIASFLTIFFQVGQLCAGARSMQGSDLRCCFGAMFPQHSARAGMVWILGDCVRLSAVWQVQGAFSHASDKALAQKQHIQSSGP